ncbi:protein FADD [Scomber scombrus]|uniref:protein FADD n=1 Tax=Scomber scombrus TaxID=13677 RepID=UPI002DDB1E17|nr:protein FADD [Scomber scombrus]
MSSFNSVLLEISNQLTKEKLDMMKYLCGDIIKKRDQESIDSGFKLFQILTERQKLAEDNTEFLSKLLLDIKREDLSEKLNNFQSQPESEQPAKERDELDIATQVIAEHLGRNWRKLGRKLGLTDPKLESISKKYPTDLEETALELLKVWRKSRKAEAREEDLIKALRECQLNLTADKVEDKLANR